ncbi:thioredoxin family protein [Candidatus Chloroploca sp. Khr17]|uniref:thioredoxin family protein n=1 Tax=Candidatus Chloroploca sp. Khr17 TaxID=2496869 RepID=UPI00101E013A|nr:thioredoxin family protein [Candidatus Chloroploca sp. Khr17]
MSRLPIGASAIPFELPGIDGRHYSLETFADHQVLGLIFSCNHCPYVQAWEERMIQVQHEYAEHGVALVLINANDPQKYPVDSFEAMQQRAHMFKYPFPYLHDQPQTTARAYGAERTPEVFLFNQARELVYHGAVDDHREPEHVQQHYLRNAIEAVLKHQPPPISETPAVGCTIKWSV